MKILHILRNAWHVYMRRKLYTAINLGCIVLTLTVLMFVTTIQQYSFYPSGVEGRGDFLEVSGMVWLNTSTQERHESGLGYKTIATYLKTLKTPSVVATVSASPQPVAAYHGAQALSLRLRWADAEYWQVMDFRTLAGRWFDAADVRAGRMVCVINASTAAQLFGAKPAVGQSLALGANEYLVIGVVEDAAHINSVGDVWVPLTTMPSTAYQHELAGQFTALLKARSTADFAAIQQEVEAAAKRFEFDDPKAFQLAYFWADTKLDRYARMGLHRYEQRDSGAGTFLGWHAFWGIVFMLLPALNLVNLNAGRVGERATEIGVRKAFGASNAQLVRQFVFENVLLCLAGGAIAYGMARAILTLIVVTGFVPGWNIVPPLSAMVVACALAIGAVFGVLSGALPAWKMARLDPVHALKGDF